MQLLAGTLASAKLPQRRPSLSTAAGARDVISDVIVRHLYNIKSVRLHRPITTERKTLPHGQLFHRTTHWRCRNKCVSCAAELERIKKKTTTNKKLIKVLPPSLIREASVSVDVSVCS